MVFLSCSRLRRVSAGTGGKPRRSRLRANPRGCFPHPCGHCPHRGGLLNPDIGEKRR
ncbi:hypothetical protein [Devosia sp. DBB001]|nr:hypothetical protein [Devosia sp. DBB001]